MAHFSTNATRGFLHMVNCPQPAPETVQIPMYTPSSDRLPDTHAGARWEKGEEPCPCLRERETI